jgi:hypothetical protein
MSKGKRSNLEKLLSSASERQHQLALESGNTRTPMRQSMRRETKFGYGFTLAGIGVPFLIERLFGLSPAIYASVACVVVGGVFLVSGHLHKENPRPRKLWELAAWGAATCTMIVLISMGALRMANNRPKERESAEQPGTQPTLGWRPVMKKWGGTTSTCTAMIDGELLMKYSEKYDAAIACGFSVPSVDRLKDTGITVTPPFAIRPRDIPVETNVSTAMINAYKVVEPRFPIVDINGVKNREVHLWYEVFLLPKNLGIEQIHKLGDVQKVGGMLLTNEAKGVDLMLKIN